MSRLASRHQKTPPEIIDQIAQSFPQLNSSDDHDLKYYLTHSYIRIAGIRENIIEEGAHISRGVLVVEGTCIITKKIRGRRIVIAQLSPYQIANIEVFLYEKAYYSVTAHSCEVRYI
jgi:hypothetical protein